MHKILTLIAVLALLLAGCGSTSSDGSSDHSGHASPTAVSESGSAGAGPSDAEPTQGAEFDRRFIASMSAHHESAIEMAQVALENAEHPEIKQLAQEIIQTQEAENEQMTRWYSEWYGGDMGDMSGMDHSDMPGMGMEGAMGVSTEELRDAKPFDRAFIDAMIPHHQAAVTDAQVALKQAQHPELRELAENIIESQQREIDQMKQWRSEWYPEQ